MKSCEKNFGGNRRNMMAIPELKQQLRVEDPRLLTGRGRYVDDLNLDGQVFMGIVKSPFAHAKIVSIDFSKIRSSPDFVDCLTGEDLLKAGVAPVTLNPWPQQRRAARYHLAVGKVRFVGEPVAAILVRNKSSVEDLVEQVEVEYEQLPAVITIEDSKQRKQLVYDDWNDNVSQETSEESGDTEKAIASAVYVVNVKEGIRRQQAAPIEPHAVLVSYDKERDGFEVRSTVQSVHGHQNVLANELKIPRQKFHVKVWDVGGGFGSKGGPSYPWPVLACLFAKRTGLPVKWTATRTEEFQEAAAGRDEYCGLTLACNKDGKMIALKGTIECDVGVSGTQAHMPSLTMWTMSGAYDIPNVDLKVRAYVTNKMPIGPVRGAGAPEGCYFIERAVEIMAKKVGKDPIEFRKLNMTKESKKKTDEKEECQLLDLLAEDAKYDDLLQWRSRLNSAFRDSRSKLVGGIGISVRGSEESDDYDEEEEEGAKWSPGGSSQSSWQNSPSSQSGGSSSAGGWSGSGSSSSSTWQGNSSSGGSSSQGGESGSGAFSFTTESAKVVLQKNGDVIVYTGSSPHGQGEETTFAQLASQELETPIEKIRVVWGDTGLIPFGVGTFGSRSAAIGGSAVVEASRKLKSKLLERAAEALAADQISLQLNPGFIIVDTSRPSESQLTVQEVFERLGTTELTADSKFTAKAMSYSSGAHLCAVTLDVETGKVKVSKYVVVEDCGRMINRLVVEGQIHGGVIHGIGGSLLEELAYDSDGNLLEVTFGDYSIPSSMDSPDVEVYHKTTPSTATLDGVKGVGESGTIGSYAAVMNALNDALSQVRSDARVDIAPALPEQVFNALVSKT